MSWFYSSHWFDIMLISLLVDWTDNSCHISSHKNINIVLINRLIPKHKYKRLTLTKSWGQFDPKTCLNLTKDLTTSVYGAPGGQVDPQVFRFRVNWGQGLICIAVCLSVRPRVGSDIANIKKFFVSSLHLFHMLHNMKKSIWFFNIRMRVSHIR